ncbi:MAG: DUF3305 domain-containing protein [Betaproteobacteria bacterium]
MSAARPLLRLAIVIERETAPNRWEAYRFSLAEVRVNDEAWGSEPRVLSDDGRRQRTLHPGFTLELFRDEGEGYHLNLTTAAPVWFVKWRIDDEDPSRAQPEAVTLSYNEAGRWLDAQERVDNLPLPAAVREWLQAFTDATYRPEPRQRKRPASFESPSRR